MNPKVHVKKGDTVLVLAGKDKGKKGKVLRVIPDKQRVVVEGVNKITRHVRPNRTNPQGGINKMEAPLAASNVMLICGKCKRPTRGQAKILGSGEKVRICKKCGEELD